MVGPRDLRSHVRGRDEPCWQMLENSVSTAHAVQWCSDSLRGFSIAWCIVSGPW